MSLTMSAWGKAEKAVCQNGEMVGVQRVFIFCFLFSFLFIYISWLLQWMWFTFINLKKKEKKKPSAMYLST